MPRFLPLSRLGCLLAALAAAPAGPAYAQAADEESAEADCLSSGDAQEAVTTQGIVAPARAIGLALGAVPKGDVLRAALCRDPDSLVYRLVVLRRDGRLVRVTVDAPSGTVKAVH
jgi:uncharacterized membrane protein YkoI